MSNAFSKINPLDAIPTEIRLLILKAVLFNPAADVVLGNDVYEQVRPRMLYPEILQTCHKYYHEGRDFLYQNRITFTREGAELVKVIKPLGLLSCCSDQCIGYAQKPQLRSVRFVLGDNNGVYQGDFYTDSFRYFLESVPGQIEIGTLTIELKLFCWAIDNKPFMFCEALEKINLKKMLIFDGVGWWDQAFVDDVGSMKGTLCQNKPEVRVLEPPMNLAGYLNWVAWDPTWFKSSENVADGPLTIRNNMVIMAVDASGQFITVGENYYVKILAATCSYGQLTAAADILDLPPIKVVMIHPWDQEDTAKNGNNQIAATAKGAEAEVHESVGETENAD